MKQKKWLLILGAALLLLFAVYRIAAGWIQNRDQQQSEAEQASLSIFQLDGLTRMAYTDGLEALSFTRTDAGWICDSQEDWSLQQNTLQTLEYLLCNLSAERVLDEPEPASVYGLDNPDYEISMTDTQNISHLLRLSQAPENENWYLAVDGDDRVFVVDSQLAESVGKPLLELVDYESAPTVDADDITEVELQYAGSVYHYDHAAAAQGEEGSDAQRVWTATRDGQSFTVDSIHIDSAVYNLLQIVPASCIAYDPSAEQLEEFGFSSPVAVVKVVYTDASGNAASYTLQIGVAYGEDAASYTLMLEGGRAVTLADADNINDMFPLFLSSGEDGT